MMKLYSRVLSRDIFKGGGGGGGGEIRVLKMRRGGARQRAIKCLNGPVNVGILDTQRVLLVFFLTSKSTAVYAYSSQCMTMLTRKSNMHD